MCGLCFYPLKVNKNRWFHC